MTAGEIVRGTVENETPDGRGILRQSGAVVFVPFALTGEQVEARVTLVKKNYAEAELLTCDGTSPERAVPDCPYYGVCGGCALRHMSYDAQLRVKRRHVADCLRRIGGFAEGDYTLREIVGTEGSVRNKAEYVRSRGFYKRGSREVVCVDRCLLQHESSDAAMRAARAWSETSGTELDGLVTRVSSGGEMMAVAFSRGGGSLSGLVAALRAAVPELCSLYSAAPGKSDGALMDGAERVELLWGAERLATELHVDGASAVFSLSPRAFFQVNYAGAEKLYSLAAEFAGDTSGRTVVDAYCGVGSVGLCAARGAGRLIGIESVAPAAADAEKNALANGAANARYIAGKCETELPRLAKKGLRPDVVITDPPRRGCDTAFLEAVRDSGAPRLVYVSCDPATFARDARALTGFGYRLREAAPVDMFPNTAGVELAARLDRV